MRRPIRKVLTGILALFLFPLAVHAALYLSNDHADSFRNANWSSVGMLPPPTADKDARLLVFAGRTGRWRGIFSVHSWIVFKPENASNWSRYDVVGWGQPVRMNGWAPDSHWFGNTPRVLVDVRGAQATALIPKVQAAIADYRYSNSGDYRIWPGPNSNTFVATVLRAVPELSTILPPNAVGKDFRPYPYAGLSAKAVAILSATYAALVMVGSFGAGGYLAGRLCPSLAGVSRDESRFRDGAHGFAVWALSVVIGAVLATSGATGVIKTALQTTVAVAAAGTAGAATNPVAGQAVGQLSTRPMDYAVDRLLAPGPAAADGNRAARVDFVQPVARAFSANLKNPQLDAKDRAMLVQMVVHQTGLPQAEAEKRVDDAFTELKAAEQKARDAAEAARKAALVTAFAAAAILAIACAAACGAAALGARHRDENTLVSLFGSRRFW